MIDPLFLLLILLFIKHYLIDFVYQSNDEITYKGDYLHWMGLRHSLKHGLFTGLIFVCFTDWYIALSLGLIDFLIHYHIDYIKMKYGEVIMTRKRYWNHLGFDQLMHYITYLFLAWSIQ